MARYRRNRLLEIKRKRKPNNKRMPWGFFLEPVNRRLYLEKLERDMRVKCAEDWYTITSDRIMAAKGFGLFAYYNQSIRVMITSLRPEYDWQLRRFSNTDFWSDMSNQYIVLCEVEKELGIKKIEDWYNVSAQEIIKLDSMQLIRNRGFFATLQFFYPMFKWEAWRFKYKVPPGYWDSYENHQAFICYFEQEANITDISDWYKITVRHVSRLGGAGLVQNFYGGSVQTMVRYIYADFDWTVHKFGACSYYSALLTTVQAKKPLYYWTNPDNIRPMITKLEEKIGIKHPLDWKRVSAGQIQEAGGGGIVTYFPSVLEISYPNYDWSETFTTHKAKKSIQRLLVDSTKVLVG